MSLPRRFRFLLWALVGSAVWLAIHPLLLTRTQTLLPDTSAVRFLYSGTATETEWLDYHHDHWRCVSTPDASDIGCGYNLALSEDYIEGVDFSGFENLKLVLELNQHQSDIAVFFRNYNSAYSNPDDGNSAQYNQLLFSAPKGRTELEIGLDEFRLAEWWLNGRDLAPEYQQPEWSNVTVIGLWIAAKAPPREHRVRIRELNLHGEILPARIWWMGLALAWCLGLIVWLALKARHYNHRAATGKETLEHLVSEHRQLYRQTRQIRDRAETDSLSGLLNRHGLEAACERLQPHTQGAITVVFVDIDWFKSINDQLGHSRGDSIIQLLAGLMMEAGEPDDLQARWGGEEFLWLCINCDERRSEERVEALRRQLMSLEIMVAPGQSVTLSAGVSLWQEGEPLQSALERADRALYWAKGSGRNRVLVAPPEQAERRTGATSCT